MSKIILFLCLVAASTMCVIQSTTFATEVVLNPVADTWIREAAPDANYDADMVSVWASNVSPGDDGANVRYGTLSFDLSGIAEPITSARLELFMVDYWRNAANDCKQDAFLVTPVVTDDSTLTWNSYQGTSPVETQLEGLGVYDLPADNTLLQYYSSTATAADVALLEAQRTSGMATFVFKAQAAPVTEEEVTEIHGRRDWADSVTPGEEPTININGMAITASSDSWVREMSPSTPAYEDDEISVWYRERDVDPEGRRVGLLEFDLSTITSPITEAGMSLFSKNNSSTGEAFLQDATLLDTQSMPGTWDDYAALTGSAFEAFGHYDLARDAPTEQYLDSDAASTADLALLEAIRTGSGKLIIALEATDQEVTYMKTVIGEPGSRDWADTESTYEGYGDPPATHPEIWPRLIINELIPVPGDANKDGVVNELDAADLAANWLVQSGATWAMGDFNGDGKVNDIDATILAGNWQTGTAANSSVPEPNCIALILCGLIAICAIRRNK